MHRNTHEHVIRESSHSNEKKSGQKAICLIVAAVNLISCVRVLGTYVSIDYLH
jgi:hypothetical protein